MVGGLDSANLQTSRSVNRQSLLLDGAVTIIWFVPPEENEAMEPDSGVSIRYEASTHYSALT